MSFVIQTKNGNTTTGRLVMTQGIYHAGQCSPAFSQTVSKDFARYCQGDWGDLGESDKNLNDEAIVSGNDRILAAYATEKGKIFILTEADRSVTTILFADEY